MWLQKGGRCNGVLVDGTVAPQSVTRGPLEDRSRDSRVRSDSRMSPDSLGKGFPQLFVQGTARSEKAPC